MTTDTFDEDAAQAAYLDELARQAVDADPNQDFHHWADDSLQSLVYGGAEQPPRLMTMADMVLLRDLLAGHKRASKLPHLTGTERAMYVDAYGEHVFSSLDVIRLLCSLNEARAEVKKTRAERDNAEGWSMKGKS